MKTSRLFFILTIAAMLAKLSSCNNNKDDDEVDYNKGITGTWIFEETGALYTFINDKGTYTDDYVDLSFTYKSDDNKLTITEEGGDVYTITIEEIKKMSAKVTIQGETVKLKKIIRRQQW